MENKLSEKEKAYTIFGLIFIGIPTVTVYLASIFTEYAVIGSALVAFLSFMSLVAWLEFFEQLQEQEKLFEISDKYATAYEQIIENQDFEPVHVKLKEEEVNDGWRIRTETRIEEVYESL
jgi:hypothetical protein